MILDYCILEWHWNTICKMFLDKLWYELEYCYRDSNRVLLNVVLGSVYMEILIITMIVRYGK